MTEKTKQPKEKDSPRKKHLKTVLLFLSPLIVIGIAYLLGVAEPAETEIEIAKYDQAPLPAAVDKSSEVEIELPTEDDKIRAKEVVTSFLHEFHSVNAKDPLEYIKEAEPYMTESLAKQYEALPKRPTASIDSMTITHLDFMPSALEKELQIWIVGVTSNAKAVDGSSELLFDQYMIEVQKERGEWLVSGVGIE